MPDGITVEQLAGVATSTFDKYDQDKSKKTWLDLTLDNQELLVMPMLLNKASIKWSDGKSIKRVAQTDHAQSFEYVGLYDDDNVTVRDSLRTYEVPWRHAKVSTGWELHEAAMCSGPSAIVDLVDTRRYAMDVSKSAGMENSFWREIPATDDGYTLYPVKYWAVRSITPSTGAWGGANNAWGAPGGFTHDRFKNWTFTFSAYTRDDLLKNWWRAYLKCNFKSPVPHKGYETSRPRWEYFVTTEGLLSMRRMAEDGNENVGYDLGLRDNGTVVFGGAPIRRVPELDETTQDVTYESIYGWDWATLHYVLLKPFVWKRTGPEASPTQRNTVIVIEDLTGNLVCDNRRGIMVGSKV